MSADPTALAAPPGSRIYQIDPSGAYVLIVPADVELLPETVDYLQAQWRTVCEHGGILVLAEGCELRAVPPIDPLPYPIALAYRPGEPSP